MGTADQHPVVALDHGDGGARHLRQLEHRHTGGQRVRREGAAQVVDPRRRGDARRLDSRTHCRRRKLFRFSGPPSGAGNSSGVSRRAGRRSSAPSARPASGTSRHEPEVFVPRTIRTRRTRSTSRRSSSAASSGRGPAAATNATSGPYSGPSSAPSASSSASAYARTGLGLGAGLSPARQSDDGPPPKRGQTGASRHRTKMVAASGRRAYDPIVSTDQTGGRVGLDLGGRSSRRALAWASVLSPEARGERRRSDVQTASFRLPKTAMARMRKPIPVSSSATPTTMLK